MEIHCEEQILTQQEKKALIQKIIDDDINALLNELYELQALNSNNDRFEHVIVMIHEDIGILKAKICHHRNHVLEYP